jgi:hypothetical protein
LESERWRVLLRIDGYGKLDPRQRNKPQRIGGPHVFGQRFECDVSKAPYNAPRPSSVGTTLPSSDATSAIQQALTDAGNAGRGVVYLPAGSYKVNTHLTVPANVKLRGTSSVPNRDQFGRSAGTVLFAYEGHNTSQPSSATAFITLNGSTAGARGFRVFYPNNNPQNGIAAYPFTIRGNGANLYVANVGLTNSFNGIDLQGTSANTDNHYVEHVVGTVFKVESLRGSVIKVLFATC